jgi:betaine-aldehyde dehydrogenase
MGNDMDDAAKHDLSGRVPGVLPREKGLYWGGSWQQPTGAQVAETVNPSTAARLAEFFVGRRMEVDDAVKAAKAAQPGWARTPPLERARRLRQAAGKLRDHCADLALIDAADCGNPVRAMLMDAEMAAAQLDYFAGLVLEVKGETIPTANGSLNYTVREPMGVVVRICAFNHPFMFAAGKIAAPLAAGNAVIVKPPEQAPLSTIRLFELLDGIFPPGVLNCVTGDRETGAALASHPDVAAVGIIGSVAAGKAVLQASTDTLKRTVLELGGKNAMIIHPDAEFDAAVEGAVRGMNFTWCGQSCGSTSRLFIHESLHDRFVDALVARLTSMHRPGLATDMRTTMGALVSRAQYDRTLKYIKLGRAEGGRVATGGQHPQDPALKDGFFVEPTVFIGVEPSMTIAREEIFGPVLSVLRWSDEDALFEAVNGVPFGLTGSVWTQDLRTAHRNAARLEAGYVWINDCSSHFLGAPFGGVKQSGLGREECKEELHEFTHVKNVNVNVRLHG